MVRMLFRMSNIFSKRMIDVFIRWRNALGLGLVFVAKDLFSVWYQYLSKRELQSRRVLNKPFEGIDSKELDLIPHLQDEIDA